MKKIIKHCLIIRIIRNFLAAIVKSEKANYELNKNCQPNILKHNELFN